MSKTGKWKEWASYIYAGFAILGCCYLFFIPFCLFFPIWYFSIRDENNLDFFEQLEKNHEEMD